jgi:thiosulfate dehydrogenase (quinone) large subunit
MSTNIETGRTAIPKPSITRFLFADSRVAPVWLVVRVYLGYLWITAGESN